MSFADLKKKSGSFDKLQTELGKINAPVASFGDDRFWKPDLDKSGNGYAVLRFLPQPEGEDLPWARIWNHAFSGPGGWYIENSLTTINKNDPVSEYNTELWNSGNEADKDTARKQKRILKYYANVLIVSDPKHPENDGRVCLYKFGKKIFDKITEAMNPEFEDETPLNPFDFWQGANFKLKIRKVDGFWNYDKSEFDSQSELYDGVDEKLEEVYGKINSLKEFTNVKNFKTYDELKEKLHKVLTGTSVQGTVESFTPTLPKTPEVLDTTEGNETLEYFAKLADDG
jgi:hypothetical protein|tara:strand:+ start:231 stop:1085 length:855 start_codon:yes stop_codon:yes gene_type:complete